MKVGIYFYALTVSENNDSLYNVKVQRKAWMIISLVIFSYLKNPEILFIIVEKYRI